MKIGELIQTVCYSMGSTSQLQDMKDIPLEMMHRKTLKAHDNMLTHMSIGTSCSPQSLGPEVSIGHVCDVGLALKTKT
jgi:hypothetical protein